MSFFFHAYPSCMSYTASVGDPVTKRPRMYALLVSSPRDRTYIRMQVGIHRGEHEAPSRDRPAVGRPRCGRGPLESAQEDLFRLTVQPRAQAWRGGQPHQIAIDAHYYTRCGRPRHGVRFFQSIFPLSLPILIITTNARLRNMEETEQAKHTLWHGHSRDC